MSYGKHMNNLTEICQQVWATSELKAKQDLLKRAVATFKYKHKNSEFMDKIDAATTEDCDQIASNLILNKTDKVVGLLKR